jgi:hypothetical protein
LPYRFGDGTIPEFLVCCDDSGERLHVFQLITNCDSNSLISERTLVATYGIPGSFAYRFVVAVSEVCKNTLQRLGDDGNKHGHLLRVPCDRYLALFIFRVPLENSHCAVSDIVVRDLISSYFRFPWRLGLRDFWAFVRPFVPCEQLPIGPRPSATLYPAWWRGYSVGYKGGGISGEYGDTIFVENGMKSNYGVWI